MGDDRLTMARAAARPLWLATPSRYAGRSVRHARWLLALLALLLLAALAFPNDAASRASAAAATAEILAEGVVEDVRHGADYYTASVQAARSAESPLPSGLAVRLPTLAVLQARVDPITAALLLYALALATIFAWWKRLGDILPGARARFAAALLAAVGTTSALLGQTVALPDLWAGLLIALSLASRRPGRWLTAAALGLSAALIRETAALYLALMMVVALLERQRREAFAWGAALAVFAIAMAVHAQAVAATLGPLDRSVVPWGGAPGFGYAVQAIVAATALSLLSPTLGALAVALALAGWCAWKDPLATRVLATIVAQLVLMALLGGADGAHWAFLIAPLVPIGLVFVPDALRDLTRAALDRRRITVTRTAA